MRNKISTGQFALTIYFLLLLGILLLIFSPTFSNPPRSDYWCLFSYFHDYQDLPVFDRVMAVVNYDVWGHGTYRPLFHLVLYWLWLAFGANYLWYHLLTFGFYCLSILLLYLLARNFGCGRVITVAFLTVFAFLFSHFDIVAWTFHLALIIGFCLCISGFLLFIRYLRTGRFSRLILSVLLFLPGMLSYEVFILWPPGLIILSFIPAFLPIQSPGRRRLRRAAFLSIVALYLAYGAVIGLTRSYSPVAGSSEVVKKLISPSRITFSVTASASAIVFNGVITNIAPILTCPVIIQDNIGRGGVFLKCSPPLRDALTRRETDWIFSRHSGNGEAGVIWTKARSAELQLCPKMAGLKSCTTSTRSLVYRIFAMLNLNKPPLIIDKNVDLDSLWQGVDRELRTIIVVAGVIALLIMAAAGFCIYRKGRSVAMPVFFSFFLLLTALFTLYHGRGITNVPLYIFRQFRYQYVPNAMVILLALFLTDRLIKAHRKARPAVYVILGVVLLINLVVLRTHISIIDRQMAPLGKMLSEIKAGLKDGRINPEIKLYLADRIAGRLPALCWNGGMAQFIKKGTYQWIFSPRELKSFTFKEDQAGWVIEEKNLSPSSPHPNDRLDHPDS